MNQWIKDLTSWIKARKLFKSIGCSASGSMASEMNLLKKFLDTHCSELKRINDLHQKLFPPTHSDISVACDSNRLNESLLWVAVQCFDDTQPLVNCCSILCDTLLRIANAKGRLSISDLWLSGIKGGISDTTLGAELVPIPTEIFCSRNRLEAALLAPPTGHWSGPTWSCWYILKVSWSERIPGNWKSVVRNKQNTTQTRSEERKTH